MGRINDAHSESVYADSMCPMTMPNNQHPESLTLSLPPEEHWTLHHVLLHRIEQELTAEDPLKVDPPPVEVFQAFDTLDSGGTRFTVAQLEAIQTVLGEYHHSATWWKIERPRLEQLLHRITELLEQHQARLPADERLRRDTHR